MAELRVRVGDQMPSVGLRATDGYLLNLRSFVTKQPACFFFFGAATLGGTERQAGDALARAFARGYQALKEANVAVVGVTTDSESQQTGYLTTNRLPYLLFSDERRTAVELLGVPVTSHGDNYNAARVVFLVQTDGSIQLILEDPDPATVVDQVIAAATAVLPATVGAPAAGAPG